MVTAMIKQAIPRSSRRKEAGTDQSGFFCHRSHGSAQTPEIFIGAHLSGEALAKSDLCNLWQKDGWSFRFRMDRGGIMVIVETHARATRRARPAQGPTN